MSLIIGLTGGIASGKTTVANLFNKHFGIEIIDADIIARQVVEPGTEGLSAIIRRYGETMLNSTGNLNRKKLREVVFSDPAEKEWLNNLLHPMIKREITHDLNNMTSPYCLLVIPLLVENNWQSLCDRILVVDVSENTQIERTVSRDQVSQKQAEKILSAQASRDQRLAIADDIIENNLTCEQLLPQVTQLHKKYLAIFSENR
ncbi:dephospho-CoA kinase [Vibrio salinus]|uniref:dephospho-CoA kinase n=1 Tax=Vibrio salinus TaxID=2899784 RepID=UPI001E40E418|nr:dephospho-CoA kinase [Vibrio salinus]MCE0493380.1 dephospho-CoA kinase [Vibrio salinus]